ESLVYLHSIYPDFLGFMNDPMHARSNSRLSGVNFLFHLRFSSIHLIYCLVSFLNDTTAYPFNGNKYDMRAKATRFVFTWGEFFFSFLLFRFSGLFLYIYMLFCLHFVSEAWDWRLFIIFSGGKLS